MWRLIMLAAVAAVVFCIDQFTVVPAHAIALGATAAVLFAVEFFVFKRTSARGIIFALAGVLFTFIIYLLITAALAPVLTEPAVWLRSFIFFGTAYLVLGAVFALAPQTNRLMLSFKQNDAAKDSKIIDTSVIIDGRLALIAETGFIDGMFIIPQFVLKEIQYLSDSADPQKRIRGRRALDILNKMKASKKIPVSISDIDFPNVPEVDLKLIELAKALNGKVITNDYNLNKVASIHDVEVLNINDLAATLRSDVLAGDVIKIELIRGGTDKHQAVGHLEDGTMVVVENADRSIGKTVDVKVLTVRQTSAGRMIFGELSRMGGGGRAPRGTHTA
ncbi:MAG: TRAM domain-containing protein [Spirochaetes bacterium]|nr:TRAM domain-containing protein [Spirochaetota bacterium]